MYIDGDTELMRILRHSEPPNHSKFEVGVLEAECTKAKELVEAITTSHMAIENILSGLDREADKSTYAKLFPESGGDEVSPTSLPFEISYDEKSRIITIKDPQNTGKMRVG